MENVQNAFDALLKTLTPEQIEEFTKNIIASIASSPCSGTQSGSELTSPEPSSPASGSVKGSRARSSHTKSVLGKKRPLNAFMAFRSFYSQALPGLPQKARSGLFREMWAAEPRKHIFALLGRAYSIVRDESGAIPLDKFLAATTALLPIISANEYLTKMKWEIKMENGEPTLSRDAAFDAEMLYLEYPTRTNVSLANIVEHCYEIGLSKNGRTKTEAHEEVAFATAPRHPTYNPTMIPASQMVQPEIAQFINFGSPHPASTPPLPVELRDDYGQSIEAVTIDQQQAFESTPFVAHFHPDAPQVLGFDPNQVQDDFDPFNLVDFGTDFNFGTDFDFDADFHFNDMNGWNTED